MKLLRTFIIAVATLAYSTASAQLTSGLTHDEKKEASLCPYIDVNLSAGPWMGNRSFKQSNTTDKFIDGTGIELGFDAGFNISKKKKTPLFAEYTMSLTVKWAKDAYMFSDNYNILSYDINIGGNIGYVIPIVKSKVELEPFAGLGFDIKAFFDATVPGSYKETGKLREVNFFSKKDESYSDAYVHAYDSEHKAKRAGVYGNVGARIILFNNVKIGYQYRPHLTKFFNSDSESIRFSTHLITIGYRFKIR